MKDAVTVSSLYVAEFFRKGHNKLMQEIKDLGCSEGFVKSTYIDSHGKKQPCYCVTREGFIALAVVHSGKKADETIYGNQFDDYLSFHKIEEGVG